MEISLNYYLFRCVHITIRGLVGRSVGWLVMLSSKLMKNGLLRILNELVSAGRGGRRDEEEGGTRRKEEWGARRVGEKGGTRRVKRIKRLSKQGRIHGISCS